MGPELHSAQKAHLYLVLKVHLELALLEAVGALSQPVPFFHVAGHQVRALSPPPPSTYDKHQAALPGEKLRLWPPVYSPVTHPQPSRQNDKEAIEKLTQQMAAGPENGTGSTG